MRARPTAARPELPSWSPGALVHPLPSGMRDLLPDEARRRRALARCVLEHFELHGYHLVTPPAFEFANGLERGLGACGPADVLRFVEPESGEVAALRPDMTPQIARMVATRLARAPRPIRLCYEGTVVRRTQGRARRHRQVPQAGVELCGLGALGGDLEVLRLAASVARAAGLERFVIDIGHAAIARALLEPLPARVAEELTEAIAHKDAARLEEIVAREAASVPAAAARALAALPELHGGGPDEPGADELFARAECVLGPTAARAALRELCALWDAARREADGLEPVLRLDFGELRGFAYYTGVIFQVLAPGPGEPIAAGGRYDELLARFGAPMPAIGFAIQLDALAGARETAGAPETAPRRALVATSEHAEAIATALRALGIPAAAHGARADSEGYAAAWAFSHVITGSPDRLELIAIGRAGEDEGTKASAGEGANAKTTRRAVPIPPAGGEPAAIARRIAAAIMGEAAGEADARGAF